MPPGWLQLGGRGADVVILPDQPVRADRQAVARSAKPIGAWKERKCVLRCSLSIGR